MLHYYDTTAVQPHPAASALNNLLLPAFVRNCGSVLRACYRNFYPKDNLFASPRLLISLVKVILIPPWYCSFQQCRSLISRTHQMTCSHRSPVVNHVVLRVRISQTSVTRCSVSLLYHDGPLSLLL